MRRNSRAADEGCGYERITTLNLSFDEDMWIDFRMDSVTEELHSIELYLPTQKAVDCSLDVLKAIDPSLSDVNQNRSREKISAYPIGKDRTLEEILKKKEYSVYAGYEDENLSIIIE